MHSGGTGPEALAGWGRFPIRSGERLRPRNPDAVIAATERLVSYLPRGRGRSYGDASLHRTVVESEFLDCICAFDQSAGVITVESGVTFSELAAVTVPSGWFAAVTPGTSHASIGGAVAADVHGKNHHGAGSFKSCVHGITLVLPSGEVVEASPSSNQEIFEATVGGMGLTGFVLTVTLQLHRIASGLVNELSKGYSNIRDLLAAMESSQDTYSVAWIDLLNGGSRYGRGVLSLGEHAPAAASVSTLDARHAQPGSFSHPAAGPLSPLHDFVMSLFNRLYFSRGDRGVERAVPLSNYFYPLDALANWNLLYGASGFIQYQFVVPQAGRAEALDAVLNLIRDFSQRPYLSVLKSFGEGSGGLMSFPMHGPTLAMDFPRRREVLQDLARLDALLVELGGRVYLAKDATSSRRLLESGYHNLHRFAQLRQQIGATGKVNSDLAMRLGI